MRSFARSWAVAAATSLALVATAGWTQSYPSKPIRMVVSFPPGAATDTLARVLGKAMQESLGQPIVVENKPGAAGNIASEAVAKAPPDGYTLLMANSTFSANVGLFAKLPFDPIRDFAPVAYLGASPLIIAVNPATGVGSLKELVERARAQPGTLSYASCGNGGPPHIVGEQFMRTQGIKVTHVPYKGCAPATTDVLAGHVPVLVAGISSPLPHLSSGKLKALAVVATRRSSLSPQIPTVAEQGLGNYEADLWYGVLAPAGTPAEVIARLNAAITQALNRPEVKDQFRAQIVEPRTMGPSEFGAYLHSEIERYSRLIKEYGIKLD